MPSSASNSAASSGAIIRAITPAASDLAVHAGAGIEPGGRDDDGVHERPLDPIEHGRLVTLVDDADRGQRARRGR